MFTILALTLISQLPQSTLGAPPQSTLEGERPSVASAPAPRAAAPSGLSVFTTSKGVELQRRVDSSSNVQIDFPGGDPSKFSEPTVYERAKERLKAASALAPAMMAAPVAPVAPIASASSLGGSAPAMGSAPATQPPAYAPAYAPPAPASSWQPLASSPGYEAFGSVGPDGTWYYDPATVRPVAGWVAQAQPAPVNYSAPAVSYAPPTVSYAPPVNYSAPVSSPCGPYGCALPGYGRPGLFGGLFRR
jgi:hypothetical protein